MSFLATLGVDLLTGGINTVAQISAQRQQQRDAEKLTDWENKTAELNYKHILKIRDFEFKQNKRIFEKSKEVYSMQLAFNAQAASRAYESENRKADEYLQNLSFKKQDMLVELVKERGKVQATDTVGRSSKRLLRDSLAQYGRNNAILAENLVSFTKQHKSDLEGIRLQKMGADLDAYSRLGLKPQKGPKPPKPKDKPTATGSTSPSLMIASSVTGAISSGLSAGFNNQANGLGFW